MNRIVLSTILTLSVMLLFGCGKQQDPFKNTENPTSGTRAENTVSSLPQDTSLPQSSIAENDMLSILQSCISEQSAMLGTGLFGYVDSESGEAAMKDLVSDSLLAEAYPFLTDCSMVLYDGAELYALVPANKDTAVTIYPAEISEEGYYIDRKESPVYIGDPGESVILRCNFSEIYANVLIAVSNGENTVEFHPMISLKDGRMVQQDGCYDFSVYEEDPEEYAWGLLLSCDEVQAALDQGMDLIYTGDTQIIDDRACLVFALGTDSDEQFVREQLYAVSDDCVYSYSTLTDSWDILSAG